MAYELNLSLLPQDIEVKVENSFKAPLDHSWTTAVRLCVGTEPCGTCVEEADIWFEESLSDLCVNHAVLEDAFKVWL